MNKNLLHTIYKYLNDKLSNRERYGLEKVVNADPFLQDAMDGFDSLPANELEGDLKKLEKRLSIKPKGKKKKLLPYYRIAASIVLFIGIGSIVFYLSSDRIFKPKLAENKSLETTKNIPLEQEILKPDAAFSEKVKELETIEPYKKEEIQEKKEQTPKGKEESPNKKAILKKETITIQEEAENDDLTSAMEFNNKTTTKQKSKKIVNITSSSAQASSPLVLKTPQKGNNIFIKGKILDENEMPLPGANVLIAGTNQGQITDLDGNFIIETDSNAVLKIAFVGYEEFLLTPKELKEQNNTIILTPDVMALNEVVVVGYGTQKRSEVTGAVSVVSGSEPDFSPPPPIFKAKKAKIICINPVDTCARPVLDKKAYKKYLREHYTLTSDVSMQVELNFIVEADGSLSDFDIINSPSQDYADELIYLLQEGPQWMPSIKDGKKISSKVYFTLIFR